MDLQELKQFILNKYPKSRKNLNGTRCANTISIEQVIFEIGQFERLCERKESPDENGNCIKPAVNSSDIPCPECGYYNGEHRHGCSEYYSGR